MSVVLLDTNIVSFLFKGDSRADVYSSLIEGHRLAISFMTVAELFEWASVRRWGTPRRHRLEQTLATYIIIPTDVELCRQWGIVRATQQAKGRMIAPQDAWIAATALRHTLPLITHNPDDVETIEGRDVRSIIKR